MGSHRQTSLLGAVFQSREKRRLKMRKNQGSRRGDQLGTTIKNERKVLSVPVRWYWNTLAQAKQPTADLGGRTKVWKTRGCSWTKVALSQCLSLPFWLLNLPLLWGILISRSFSKWAVSLLGKAPKASTTIPNILWGTCPVKASQVGS